MHGNKQTHTDQDIPASYLLLPINFKFTCQTVLIVIWTMVGHCNTKTLEYDLNEGFYKLQRVDPGTTVGPNKCL